MSKKKHILTSRQLSNRHGKRPNVKCPLCKNLYARLENVKNHLKKQHGTSLQAGSDIDIYHTSSGTMFSHTKTYFPKEKGKKKEERTEPALPLFDDQYGPLGYVTDYSDDLLDTAIEMSRLDTSTEEAVEEGLHIVDHTDPRKMTNILEN